ncbi:hypothetical protein [Streptomyces sp. NPDC048644]|uniref:hypothetical protein n=1 Tax=Streptomyces sp. NPDC048644 TaxID=3365582 RepID=UPI0037121C41
MNAPSPERSSPVGEERDWAAAPEYVLRSLPEHAARAGMIDDVLGEDGFLLHGDLVQLLAFADRAVTERGRNRALLLSLTPAAADAGPAERAALFAVTAAMEDIADAPAPVGRAAVPYRVAWARTRPRTEVTTLDGEADRATAVCVFEGDDGRPRLAGAGYTISQGMG